MDYTHILQGIVITLFSIVLGFGAWWVRKLEKEQDKQDTRLAKQEDRLNAMDKAAGVLEAQLTGIRELLEQHMEREENVMWKRIEAIDLANQEAHAAMYAGLTALTGDVRELAGVVKQLATTRTIEK